MKIEEIISNNKKTIIFNDTNLSDREEIRGKSTNLNLIFNILSKKYQEIVVISESNKKIEVFEEAIKNNITIEFISIGSLKKIEIDLNLFENAIIVFDKCFNGMASKTNNTYINIKKIMDNSKKFIGIDNIGENFLYPNYFSTMLGLMDIDIEFDYYNINLVQLNKLLFDNFVIMSQEETINMITKNYWYNAEMENIFINYDVSNKLSPIIKNTEPLKIGMRKSNKKERKSKVLINKYLYIFLAFFLGYMGAHKFYARKFKLGILYLLFFWTYIPMVISWIELVIAIGINTDDNGKFYI